MARRTRPRQAPLASAATRRYVRRRGARPPGRRPGRLVAGVSHLGRPVLPRGVPVHVTLRLGSELPGLRRPAERAVLFAAFREGKDRFGFRLVHCSIQANHLHLVAEAADRHCLSRGMQGLAIRMALALNRLWGRSGTVFEDRYHATQLQTPRTVRNALAYVLRNHRRHGNGRPGPDWFSSGAWFDGWRDRALQRPKGLVHDPAAETAVPADVALGARLEALEVGRRARGPNRDGDAVACRARACRGAESQSLNAPSAGRCRGSTRARSPRRTARSRSR